MRVRTISRDLVRNLFFVMTASTLNLSTQLEQYKRKQKPIDFALLVFTAEQRINNM